MVKDVDKLKDCAEIKRFYIEALENEGWPAVCDKVEDQYPPTSRLTLQQKETVALSYSSGKLTAEPSSGKRKRKDDDLPAPPPPPQRRRKGKH